MSTPRLKALLEACNCIPAADNPEVSSSKDAAWLKDDDIVFGFEVTGEYRAYLHMDRAEPAGAQNLSDAPRVIIVGFVSHC